MTKCGYTWTNLKTRCESAPYWGMPSNHQCVKEFEVEYHVHQCTCGQCNYGNSDL